MFNHSLQLKGETHRTQPPGIILVGGVSVNGMYTIQGSIEAGDPIIRNTDYRTGAVAFLQ